MAQGSDSASDRNEHQAYFLEGKGGRCVGLTTLPPSWAYCLEIYELLNLLETSGPVQSCSGIAFTQHILKSVQEQQDMTVLWNQAIRTDGEVLANKPDNILKKINVDY